MIYDAVKLVTAARPNLGFYSRTPAESRPPPPPEHEDMLTPTPIGWATIP